MPVGPCTKAAKGSTLKWQDSSKLKGAPGSINAECSSFQHGWRRPNTNFSHTVLLNRRQVNNPCSSCMWLKVLSRPGGKSPLCPAHPCCTCFLPLSHLGAISVIRSTDCRGTSACVQVTLTSFNKGPQHNSSDAGNLDTPRRSHKVHPLSEKVCM